MKLNPRDAAAWAQKPDPRAIGALICGEDAARIAAMRRQAALAIAGPQGESEMRVTHLAAADLRKDASLLGDATRAASFFPGPRLVLLDDATDGLTGALQAALEQWQAGDAQLIVTAGALQAKSTLRKLAESHRALFCIVLADDPPGPGEIAALAQAAGLSLVDAGGRQALADLSRLIDSGSFRQTIDRLALYKLRDSTPVSAADIAATAPLSGEVAADDLMDIIGGQAADKVPPMLARLYAQGLAPTGICIAALRHFKGLHLLASEPGDAGSALFRLRPPPPLRRRDGVLRQARDLGLARIERALTILLDTDLELRSSTAAPQQALVERALIRIAMLGRG